MSLEIADKLNNKSFYFSSTVFFHGRLRVVLQVLVHPRSAVRFGRLFTSPRGGGFRLPRSHQHEAHDQAEDRGQGGREDGQESHHLLRRRETTGAVGINAQLFHDLRADPVL